MCTCGNCHISSWFATAPGFIAGWAIFWLSGKSLLNRSALSVDGILSILGLLILSWFFVKSYTDVLWLGRDSLFPKPAFFELLR